MGEIFLTDIEIQDLIARPKIIPLEFNDFFYNQKEKKGHKGFDYLLENADGSCFAVRLRQSIHNIINFSAILAYRPTGTYSFVILTRYNGKSHEHRNPIEHDPPFYDFHIHLATERYQLLRGRKAEHYAEKTNRYSSLREAFKCLIDDCAVSLQQDPQMKMFE